MGKSLEVIKDLGNAKDVCDRYNLDKIVGTHAIGHATVSYTHLTLPTTAIV